MLKKLINFSAIACILSLQACLIFPKVTIKGKGNLKLKQVDFSDLKNWQQDDHKKALQSLIHSCNKFAHTSPSRQIGKQLGNITVGDFHDVCEIASVVKNMSNQQSRNFFENWFKPFLVETSYGNSNGLFTGYYEARLNGSKIKTEKYQYPLYAKPKDLDPSSPYLTRAEIESGALKNKNLELIYVDDKVELFFLHIQGSGRITLENGAQIHATYAGRNNQTFTGIGTYMADRGYIAHNNISATSIKKWLRENPDKADEVMNINPAYTFFKFSDGEYVVGAQNVPLSAERSLAVDSDIVPYGFPLWVETSFKNKNGVKEKFEKLVIAQDTGSAIKGVIRGDIFFGHGDEAEEKASSMASSGRYYILLPINIVDKISGR